jgi:hypothetical protein
MFEKSFIVTYFIPYHFEYDSVLPIIETFQVWGRISENTWIIKTLLTPKQIHDAIRPFLPDDARLFVSKVQRNASWSNIICSSDWLNNNLSVL